ncbi:MAG: LamG domain-containing protein [Armatimonadota bacterium]
MRFFALFACILLALSATWTAGTENLSLRGYRDFRHSAEARGGLTIHRFTFGSAERAAWFASKIYADFELTRGNALKTLATKDWPVDGIDLAGSGVVAPLLARGSRELLVYTGETAAVTAGLKALVTAAPMRRAALSHPLYLDKWDRHCLGVWQAFADYAQDDRRPDPDSFYQWMSEIGLNPQINLGTTSFDMTVNDSQLSWLRHYFAKYGNNYQRVEWLLHAPDLYNRNPFLAKSINPHVAARWSYYGEVREGQGLLRDVQTANYLAGLKRTLGDPNQMAILDPDGEIGPFDVSYWGVSGPLIQREYVRFLKEVRKLSLPQVSQRYYGRQDALKRWEDVTLADWRAFYGWTTGAVDLAGEWRFLRDDKLEGFRGGWALPAFNDADWVRLHYPGDAAVYSLASKNRPLWMRKTVTVDPKMFDGKIYLSLAPLSAASVQVFLNGRPLGSLDPHFHTALTYGQYDITDEVAKTNKLTVTLRFAAGDTPNGPIFLTPKKIEGFPTSNPLVNARRWDQLEFVDWATAQGVASTLRAIRAVEPDRPIKVHAYASSPWGWKTVAAYGGYSHHTGSGSGWHYTDPKQFGAARNLQDSSEPGGPMHTLRDLKGLWGNLVYMGKNAHDYFISLQSITKDPQMRAFFEAKIPDIKVMGRANVLISPIGVMRGQLNCLYEGEFARWELWRYGVHPVRGGEMAAFLDEIRIREGNLGRFRVIIDEGTPCWDDEMVPQLRAYVENGGILVLNSFSGAHTFITRDGGAGPTLAGVKLSAPPKDDRQFTITQDDPRLPGFTGTIKNWARPGVRSRALEPLAGTEIIGAWPDGTPALTRKALGKGFVYYFGGNAYPGELIKTLAAAYGPECYVQTEGGVDISRTLRSNNGCEDLLMLRGLGKPATVRWTFDYVPQGIYNPVSGKVIEAKIAGKTATFSVNIPDWDFSWFAARRPAPAEDFAHWFTRQTEIWSGVAADAKEPQVPLFRHLDLTHDWSLAQTDSLEKAQALLGQEAGFAPTELLLWNTPGMNVKTAPGTVGVYRRDFDLPKAWENESLFALAVRGQIHNSSLHGFRGKGTIYLNGQKVWEGERIDSAWLDITAQVKPGRNRLEIIHQGNGLMASLMLARSAKPETILDLAGPWRAVDGLQEEREVVLPAVVKTSFVYRDVPVPTAQRGKEVWLRVEGTCNYAIINGRLRYWDIWGVAGYAGAPAYEIDITPDVRFGGTNRIVLGTNGMFNGWQINELKYSKLELCFYRPGQWSADGKGTRAALTPAELAAVERNAQVIKQYALVHQAVEKPAPGLPGDDGKPAALPNAILDLELHPAQGIAVDRGPNKVPVTVKGPVEPFTEAGGKIVGVYLRGDIAHSTLEMPSPVFRRQMAGKNFTIRAWVKPMAINQDGGALFNWGSWLFDISIYSDRASAMHSSVPQRRLLAETVIRQRVWQCLTYTMDGAKGTLYVDGIPVGLQTWDGPLPGVDVPPTIGSEIGTRNPLNAKLAAFSIYAGAMSPEDVARQYRQEAKAFLPDFAAGYPEDDLFRLAAGENGPVDTAELPARVEVGQGITTAREGGASFLSFDGKRSYLLVRDHPRVGLLHRPFSLVWDMRVEAGAGGMIFRRHHGLCLQLNKDGSLTFDANIGRRNMVNIPNAVIPGKWNRLMLSYDGNTMRLFRDGVLLLEKDYPGNLYQGDYPLVIFADNTYGKFPEWANITGDLREFRFLPVALNTMPPAP